RGPGAAYLREGPLHELGQHRTQAAGTWRNTRPDERRAPRQHAAAKERWSGRRASALDRRDQRKEPWMIARHWRGWTTQANADAYETLLEQVVLPRLKQVRVTAAATSCGGRPRPTRWSSSSSTCSSRSRP